jgi:hypothetical protein
LAENHLANPRNPFMLTRPNIAWLPQKIEWAGLQGIGMVQSVVEERGKKRDFSSHL